MTTTTAGQHQARHADLAPDEIRGRLSGAELDARCTEIGRLREKAATPGLEPEISRYLTSRAARIAKADCVACYIERSRQLTNAVNGVAGETATAYRAVLRQHRSDHQYPDGLEGSVDDALLGKTSTDVAVAIAKHHASKHRGRG